MTRRTSGSAIRATRIWPGSWRGPRGRCTRRGLARSASEYTFTTTFTGATRDDDDHVAVTQHLEGDFPGGVVDLTYRFTLRGDLIAGLHIAP